MSLPPLFMHLSRRYLLLLLIILVLGVYYPALFVPPCLLDDYTLLIGITNQKFTLKEIFFPGNVGYYRPLFFLVLWGEKLLWMLDASFLHLDNVVMHLANVILTYFLALSAQRLYLRREVPLAACVAAAIFAIHPLCIESVMWISGRTDPLAGIFMLTALIAFFKGLEKSKNRYYLLSFISLFVSALAKEPAVFQVPSFLYIGYCYMRNHLKLSVTEDSQPDFTLRNIALGIKPGILNIISWIKGNRFVTALFITLPFSYVLTRKIASTTIDRSTAMTYSRTVNVVEASLWDPVFISLKTMGFYLKKAFIPWPLNFNIVAVSEWYIIVGILLVLVIIYLLWRSDLVGGLFILAITLTAPALFVAVAKLGWVAFAERYLYMAIPPFLIAFMLLVLQSRALDRYRTLLGVSIIALFALTTVQRNILWTDSLAFYGDCLNKAPNFYWGIRNYAAALAREGKVKEAEAFRRKYLPAIAKDEYFSDSNSANVSNRK